MTHRALLFLYVLGCSDKSDPADTSDTTSPDDTAETTGPADIYISEKGSSSGSGSATDPVDSMDAALSLVEDPTQTTIHFEAGTFEVRADLTEAHSGLSITGSGEDTTLTDSGSYIFRIAEATDITISALSLSGGERTVRIWQGAEVSLSQVSLYSPERSGFLIDGVDTIVVMDEVTVHDPVVGETNNGNLIGYGIVVDNASLRMTGGGVYGATVAGIMASSNREDGTLYLEDVEVTDTLPDKSGYFGRGIHLQSTNEVELVDCILSDNQDSGLFAILPRTLSVSGTLIERTAASDIPDEKETTGDGITITGLSDGTNNNPADFTVTLSDNTVSDADRIGILLERVTATINGNAASGKEGSIEAQDSAVVSGEDAYTTLKTSRLLNYDELEVESASD